MSAPRILLVVAPTGAAQSLADELEAAGYQIVRAGLAGEVRPAVERAACDLILADPVLLQEAIAGLEITPKPPLVLFEDFFRGTPSVDGFETLDTIVRPASNDQVLRTLRSTLEKLSLEAENQKLRQAIDKTHQLGELFSRDERMRRIFDTVRSVADSRASLLIQGETGTGKTVLARTIHQLSAQRDEPFVVVNCGALPTALLESELFGHVRGAFTGAVRDKQGKFAAADGGTIFLDEIGTAPPELQVKLLRVIEEGRFERVGDTNTHEVDVRIVAATNEDVPTAVKEGRFRADLYYRINVVTIRVPPLRERPGDIPSLAERFLEHFAKVHDRQVEGIAAPALSRLCAHPWPGNVRELENTLERAVLLARGSLLGIRDLWPDAPDSAAEGPGAPGQAWRELPIGPLKKALEPPERWLILRALRHYGGNRQETARALGINRTTLFNKMRKYNLSSFPTRSDQIDEDGDSPFAQTG